MFFETPESPRVLKQDLLDFFTRVHWASVPILFVPLTSIALAFSLWRAHVTWYTTLALFVVGFTSWTFVEYWMHRMVFHWAPTEGWGKTFHFWVHGIHHRWPDDPYRLVMPPWVNLSLLFLVVGPVVLWTAPSWGWAWLAGFMGGYMHYDVTHYFLHHTRPQRAHYKRLRAHHMNHHHNKLGRRFGVSSMFWDRLFGTM